MINKMLDAIMAISMSIIILILSSLAILNTRYIYYYDIEKYDITETSSLSIDKIKDNYEYIINFINDNRIKEFDPPSISSSETGNKHFKDVRNIFNLCKYSTAILIAITISLAVMRRPRKLNFLKYSAYTIIVFAISLATTFWLSFDKAFIAFHTLFFNDDTWMFDPTLDPIIEILPEEFFMDSAIGVLTLSLFFSLIILISFRILKKVKK